MLGLQLTLPAVVLGGVTGLTYGLLAVGIVLVYRANKLINFAHGEVGLFGAAIFLTAWATWGLPYYAALVMGLAAGAAASAVAEVAVVRRLRNAPRVMSIVATLGVGRFLVFFAASINPSAGAGNLFPMPPGLPEFDVGALRMTQAYTGMLLFGPMAIGALTVFLRRSRLGIAMRCAAANPAAARLAAVSVSRMSSMAWAIAGALSALTAILVIPTVGFTAGSSFGPSLLLRALAGAVVARMVSLPIALATGVGLGIVESVLTLNYPQENITDVALYVVIVGALLLQRGVETRREQKSSWVSVQKWRPLPDAIRGLPEVRAVPFVLAGVAVAAGVFVPLWLNNSSAVTLSLVLCFAIVGLSVGIITGLGGQLSLGQFGIAAVGAAVSYQLSSNGAPFFLAVAGAALAASLTSLVIGLPSLRYQGVMLTVTTLGFAMVASTWLLHRSWLLGDGVAPGRPEVFGVMLDTGQRYYYFTLAMLVLATLLARNVWHGGVGRRLEAVRDNEDVARAFAVSARVVKVQGLLLAGAIAGLGGATYGHLLIQLEPSAFPVGASIDVVAMTVIGGASLLAGPLLGAFYVVGLPAFVPLDSAGLAATQLGWLVLILYVPGGLAQCIEPVRARYIAWVAHRRGISLTVPTQQVTESDVRVRAPVHIGGVASAPLALRAAGLMKRYGGVVAVNDVSIAVEPGEIVGLIGPNGAGKTTTFELLGGFSRAHGGRVMLGGEDVSRLGPEARAQRGLIRSFQDAALFPTMTVLDVVRLSLERTDPTRLRLALFGIQPGEHRKDRQARELVGSMGLDPYRHAQIRELSTGTRRITEFACLLALRPSVLLLDEPSSGVAQRETEALGRLLVRIRDELDLAMLVIEHDIPMVMGISDRVVAMESGRVIAEGTPEAVRTDARVVEAYLGGSLSAIERSDATRYVAGT